jgi:hypothetical protein
VKLKELLVIAFLISLVSTAVYIDVALTDSLTVYKLLSPIIFVLGLLHLNFKKLNKFNLVLFLLITVFLVYGAMGSNQFLSLANIALLSFGTFGIYILYENTDRSRRGLVVLILILALFVQFGIELILLNFNFVSNLFIFPTVGRIDGWATEPSHFIYILLLLTNTYVVSFNVSKQRILLFVPIILTAVYFSSSAYGYLFLVLSAVIISSNYGVKINPNLIKSFIKYVIISAVVITVIAVQSDISQRLIDTAIGVFSGDDQVIDQNARVRLLPFLIFIEKIDSFPIGNLFFGHGLGSSGYFIRDVVGVNTPEGHLTSYLYDFGLVGLLWLVVLLGFITKGLHNNFWIRCMLFIMMFNMNVGTQVFWFSVFCIAVIRLEQRYSDGLLKNRSLRVITTQRGVL